MYVYVCRLQNDHNPIQTTTIPNKFLPTLKDANDIIRLFIA